MQLMCSGKMTGLSSQGAPLLQPSAPRLRTARRPPQRWGIVSSDLSSAPRRIYLRLDATVFVRCITSMMVCNSMGCSAPGLSPPPSFRDEAGGLGRNILQRPPHHLPQSAGVGCPTPSAAAALSRHAPEPKRNTAFHSPVSRRGWIQRERGICMGGGGGGIRVPCDSPTNCRSTTNGGGGGAAMTSRPAVTRTILTSCQTHSIQLISIVMQSQTVLPCRSHSADQTSTEKGGRGGGGGAQHVRLTMITTLCRLVRRGAGVS